MEAVNFNRPGTRWKKKTQNRLPILSISLLTLILSLLFLLFYKPVSNSLLPVSTTFQSDQCGKSQALDGEKFIWYAPHSGFSNQLSEFKNGLLMAAILNRTLIVPPILDHHAVVLGSCPKFRVLEPKELRYSVWNHVIELLQSHRYMSMGDIIDLSSLSRSGVRFIDLRQFISLWCDVNIDLTCVKDLNVQSGLLENLRKCGSVISGYKGNINDCLYAVDEDCRTTVWTFQRGGEDGTLDSFQPDEKLKKKKKISFARRRKDVYHTLGPGSTTESATVLAFGSLFTGPYKGSESYIDIHEAPNDQRIQTLIEKIEFLPFVPEITSAGKDFSLQTIKSPFLCAQLRLLDGQFKNHWKATFLGLKQKLESLKQKGPLPIHIFVMTDLPMSNWSGTFLGDLAADLNSFKLFVLREEDELTRKTAKKVSAARHGLEFRSVPKILDGIEKRCSTKLPDIVLQVEEAICSCGTLGFVGTAGSTIAESIETMRKNSVCEVLA